MLKDTGTAFGILKIKFHIFHNDKMSNIVKSPTSKMVFRIGKKVFSVNLVRCCTKMQKSLFKQCFHLTM